MIAPDTGAVQAVDNVMVAVPAPPVTVAPIAIPVPVTYQPVIAAFVFAVMVTVATPTPPPDENVLVIAVDGPQGEKIITPDGARAWVPLNVSVTVPAPLATVVPGVMLVPVTYHPFMLLGVVLANVIDVVVALDTLSRKSRLASDILDVLWAAR